MAAHKQPRIWIDGCFDLFHHGHANAVRQAAEYGPLTVGVHSNEDIELNKGPPVLSLEERLRLVAACRWVGSPDDVVGGAPYVTDVDYVKRRRIDYVVHGDDVSTDAEGRDTYRHVKAAGKYRECKRTEGVSTTDAIARVLTGSNVNPAAPMTEDIYLDLLRAFAGATNRLLRWPEDRPPSSYADLTVTTASSTPPSAVMCSVGPLPADGKTTVYISGSFDAFLSEHVDQLQQLARDDTFVVVGILDAEVISQQTGRPAIFSLQERTLSVMQCKHVHAVVSPAPSSAGFANLFGRHIKLPCTPSPLYERIEARREALEARQARKLGKSAVEAGLRGSSSA